MLFQKILKTQFLSLVRVLGCSRDKFPCFEILKFQNFFSIFSRFLSKNKGHKSGLRFLVAQPFGLKLWISVENYLINKTYNDASRYQPYCTLYIRVCTNTPVHSAKNSKIRLKQGLQKWLAIFSGSTVRAETPDISGQLPNKQNVQ